MARTVSKVPRPALQPAPPDTTARGVVVANTTAATITTQATTAIGLNRTFLALVTPSNAEVVAQVRRLTRQNNGIIRLLVNRASLADGTVD